MSCIVKARHGNVVYVYSSESYWVPGVGCRNKRTLIGKLDPETGEIVPTGRRGRKPKAQEGPSEADQVQKPAPSDSRESALNATKAALIAETERRQELEKTVRELERKVSSLEAQLSSIASCVEGAASVVQRQMDKCVSAIRSN